VNIMTVWVPWEDWYRRGSHAQHRALRTAVLAVVGHQWSEHIVQVVVEIRQERRPRQKRPTVVGHQLLGPVASALVGPVLAHGRQITRLEMVVRWCAPDEEPGCTITVADEAALALLPTTKEQT